jgi:hypothetical protein
MKKITFLLAFLILSACGVRSTQSMLSNGDYDGAITRALEGLRTKKNAKGNQDYVYLLEEAFAKAKDRDLSALNLLLKEKNPANLEKIFDLYNQLNNRQERIKPVLPLKLLKERRDAYFPFQDYSDDLVKVKADLAEYLYTNAQSLLKSRNKLTIRSAYDDLAYLQKIFPGYKDVSSLMEQAQMRGTDFVLIESKNDTQMIIPERLQTDMLDFSTYGLNDIWTVYHNKKVDGVVYDYGLNIIFRTINISPEQVKEKQFVKEKVIVIGKKNLLDSNGNPVKDQNGNPIKVDDTKTVTASIYEFGQFKSCNVVAKVEYVDKLSKQLIDTYPLNSEFVFDYKYATFNGDRRACDDDYLIFFDRRAVPFPSNEQMVFDSGETLKANLKNIIINNKFRRN